jgi:hypothetical protein
MEHQATTWRVTVSITLVNLGRNQDGVSKEQIVADSRTRDEISPNSPRSVLGTSKQKFTPLFLLFYVDQKKCENLRFFWFSHNISRERNTVSM